MRSCRLSVQPNEMLFLWTFILCTLWRINLIWFDDDDDVDVRLPWQGLWVKTAWTPSQASCLGCESHPVQKSTQHGHFTVETIHSLAKLYRRVTWKDKVTNAELLAQTGQRRLQDIVWERRFRFAGLRDTSSGWQNAQLTVQCEEEVRQRRPGGQHAMKTYEQQVIWS